MESAKTSSRADVVGGMLTHDSIVGKGVKQPTMRGQGAMKSRPRPRPRIVDVKGVIPHHPTLSIPKFEPTESLKTSGTAHTQLHIAEGGGVDVNKVASFFEAASAASEPGVNRDLRFTVVPTSLATQEHLHRRGCLVCALSPTRCATIRIRSNPPIH